MNTLNSSLQLIECPRDAMQGLAKPISTAAKVAYFNQLLQVGFHTLDMGSFVSTRAVPQMADTPLVLEQLEKGTSATKLLVIVASTEGATRAVMQEKVDVLGYPYSISASFQQLNTRQTLAASTETMYEIKELCLQKNKELVVYLSMAFGNPYGDPYHLDLVLEAAVKAVEAGANTISLADTVGLSTPQEIQALTTAVQRELPQTSVGLHLHATHTDWQEKIEAGYMAGCRRFDGALGGYGGCPFTGSELVGNIDTFHAIQWFTQQGVFTTINQEQLLKCTELVQQLF
jgi:hydroxymethylglutaryl-CoA lyase